VTKSWKRNTVILSGIGLAGLMLGPPAAVAARGSHAKLAPVVDADAQYVALSPSARAVRDAIEAIVPASEYGGISWDRDNNLSVVYLKSTPAATRAKISAQMTLTTEVSERLGVRSLASLHSLSDHVWTGLPRAIINEITGVTINLWTNRVQIHFSTVTTRERAAAWAAFGDAVEVSQVPASQYL
jgi:hypothetical protein